MLTRPTAQCSHTDACHVDVALPDAVERHLVDAGRLQPEERGLEERPGAPEALGTDLDDLLSGSSYDLSKMDLRQHELLLVLERHVTRASP